MTTPANNFYTRKLAENRAILAPMAGYTDAPFRKLCREFGSNWAVTEMVSAKGLVQGDLRGIEIGEPYPGEPDVVIQVFGGEPEIVAEGGKILYDKYQPDALDLNMGCPVKKITGKSCGSKLMQDPKRAAEIIRQLVSAVPIPVSAKMRLGYDRVNVLEVALALQEAGVSLIAIHGRTAEQKYTGEAKWEAIKEVAEQLIIPVIGSGDVQSKEQFDRYGAWGLGVMIARGAMGRPWIFAELQGAEKPSVKEIIKIAYRHAELHCDWYKSESPESEFHAMRSLRSQLIHYFSFMPETRPELAHIGSLERLRDFINRHWGMDIHSPSNSLNAPYWVTVCNDSTSHHL
jgi:tRNA-dihydrouridine synthase B